MKPTDDEVKALQMTITEVRAKFQNEIERCRIAFADYKQGVPVHIFRVFFVFIVSKLCLFVLKFF